MPNCRTNLLGIMVVYCDGDNKRKQVWLDLDEVKALSWCNGEVKEKKSGETGNGKLPGHQNAPGNCPTPADSTDITKDLCWWNGSEWVCGAE